MASACTRSASSADKRLVDQAMARDAGLAAEGFRHDINPEMRLSARPVARMAFMLVRFIHHFEAFGRESARQFLCDHFFGGHDGGISQV